MFKLICGFAACLMAFQIHAASGRSSITVSIIEVDDAEQSSMFLSMADQAMEALIRADMLMTHLQLQRKNSAPQLPALQQSCDDLTQSLINLVVLRSQNLEQAQTRLTRSLSSLEEWCPDDHPA